MAARRGVGGAPGVARRARSPRGARALRARARASAAVVLGEEFDAVVARALEAPDVAAARDMCQAALPALEAGRCKREARKMERASRTLEVKRGASEYQNEGGSWVRYDGIIVVPANYEDFKTWAVSPEMSGDYQIILLVLASILSAFGYEEYGIDRRLSGGVFTFLKVLGIAWASLYWCQACSDFVLAL